MIAITVLGSTGSIGLSTLDVVARHPQRYRVVALTANTGVDRMVEQCRAFLPKYAVMADESAAFTLEKRLKKEGLNIEVSAGVDALIHVATLDEVDCIMAAIVGAAGLLPTIAAASAGKKILLANKEALVMSGPIFMNEVRNNNATLLPVDSEHNAIFQCMPRDFDRGLEQVGVQQILLTASGGPFRTRNLASLDDVTPEEACAHPNWAMGRKISVDSATMMNKGLEVIEACWLFSAPVDKVEVVLHPQSVVHSMVEYSDGSVLAQLGSPDMRTPIAHAMAWPERIDAGVERLNLFDVARLDFERPDIERFPCLRLAYQTLKIGGTATTILNAANEVAVDAFLKRQLKFTAIHQVIEHTLDKMSIEKVESLDVVLAADEAARSIALDIIQRSKS